jgi:hypothetical protein
MADYKSSLPVLASDFTGNGTIAALGQTVVANTVGQGTALFFITGTWVGTIIIQGNDGDGNFVGLKFYSSANNFYTNNTLTANGIAIINSTPFLQLQAIATLWTSGTAIVSWSSGPFSGKTQVYQDVVGALIASAYTFDGAGNSIGSTAGSLNVFTTNANVPDLSPVHANALLSPIQTVTTTESSLQAPVNAVAVIFESDSSNLTNIRWGISNAATNILSSTLGLLMEPGRDSGYLEVGRGCYLHFIALSGSNAVQVQWVLSS